MLLYLSSYKVGSETAKLKEMFSEGKRIVLQAMKLSGLANILVELKSKRNEAGSVAQF